MGPRDTWSSSQVSGNWYGSEIARYAKSTLGAWTGMGRMGSTLIVGGVRLHKVGYGGRSPAFGVGINIELSPSTHRTDIMHRFFDRLRPPLSGIDHRLFFGGGGLPGSDQRMLVIDGGVDRIGSHF